MAAGRQLRVTVWNEHVHERREPSVTRIYPGGMHAPIVEGIRRELGDGVTVRVATLEEPEHGLGEEALAETDVLTWWGHAAHDQVADEVVARVHARVLDGMGIVVLHSGHYSKIFRRLMGTSCSLIWRSDPGGERELVWTVDPAHPIAAGVPQPIVIPHQEMYGEFFDIPPPDELVFISSYEGGEVFRGGCCYRRGAGRVLAITSRILSRASRARCSVSRMISWVMPSVNLSGLRSITRRSSFPAATTALARRPTNTWTAGT